VKQEDDAPLVLSLAPAAAVGEGNAATVGAGPAAAGPSRPGLPPRPRPAGGQGAVWGIMLLLLRGVCQGLSIPAAGMGEG
jgi:hypothetical protein